MRILKNIDAEHQYQGFLKVKIVEKINELKKIDSQYKKVVGNIPGLFSNYLYLLDEFEKNKEYEYKKGYKKRYGVLFTVLVPEDKFWNDLSLIKIASRFHKYVVGEEKGLKYQAYKMIKGKAIYLKIYIADRESYIHSDVKRYKRDAYVDIKTHRWCSKDNPNAMIKYKKGEYIKNAQGDIVIEKKLFKDRKSRRFIYKNFNAWIDMFKDLFFQTLLYFKERIKITYGKYFKRLNLKGAFTRYKRRIVKANNLLMQYIQNTLNYELQIYSKYPDAYDIKHSLYDEFELIPQGKTKDIYNFFDKYRKIFTSGEYLVNEVVYKIAKCRCDLAEDNLENLKHIFNIEINNFRKEVKEYDLCTYKS